MTLVLYLSRVFGGAVAAAVFGLTMIGLGVDLLDSAADVLAAEEGPGLGRYALLRAATIASSVLPMGVLAGGAIGFLRLGSRSELTVLRAAGLSLRGVVGRLAPLALLLGAAFSALAFWAAPAAERALALSFGAFSGDRQPGVPDDIWARTPSALVRIGEASLAGDRLTDVTVFELMDGGSLSGRIDAREARYRDGDWILADGVRRPATPGPRESFDRRAWTTRLTPADVLRLEAAPETVTPIEARATLAGIALAARAPSFYAVRVHRAPAALLKPYLMLLFASPLGLATLRGGPPPAAILGLVFGVIFVGVDMMAAMLGERGLLAPAAAVWIPPFAFALLGFWTLLLAEE